MTVLGRIASALAVFATVWLGAVPAGAATAFVQSKSTQGTGTSATTIAATFTANVAAGNLIAVAVAWLGTTQTASVADSLGNTYTAGTIVDGGGRRHQAFYAKNISGGANTVTVTFSDAVAYRDLIVHEISGADTTAPLDVSAQQWQAAPGTATDGATSGSATTTVGGCYIFGATFGNSIATVVAGDIVAGTNFTTREQMLGGADAIAAESEDRIQASAGSVAATFTLTGNSGGHATFMMAFKPAGGQGQAPRSIHQFRLRRP